MLTIRRKGLFVPLCRLLVTAEEVRQLAYSMLRPEQRLESATTMEYDLSIDTPDGKRFRVSVHMQRGQVGMVTRHVVFIPGLDALGLPPLP